MSHAAVDGIRRAAKRAPPGRAFRQGLAWLEDGGDPDAGPRPVVLTVGGTGGVSLRRKLPGGQGPRRRSQAARRYGERRRSPSVGRSPDIASTAKRPKAACDLGTWRFPDWLRSARNNDTGCINRSAADSADDGMTQSERFGHSVGNLECDGSIGWVGGVWRT